MHMPDLASEAGHDKLNGARIQFMTIHLPSDLERSIQAAVASGRFSSIDAAMTEAARLLLRELSRNQPPVTSPANADEDTPDPILGLMRDDAELMDEIVADAYRRRREEKWRDIDL
jgi:Arc/MetJ-type ribon-helix-helix transcriptional regulator